MQIKLFTIPVIDNGKAEEEINKFLQGHKVLELIHEFSHGEHGAAWHFCIKYLESTYLHGYNTYENYRKTDYRTVLDEKAFRIFCKLRECRKQTASEFAVPAFAIFTDEQMADVARLAEINEKNLLTVKGIGEKTVQKFGKRLLELFYAGTAGMNADVGKLS